MPTDHPRNDHTRRGGLKEVALAFAKRSVPVFRLRPRTKEPFHGSRGFYDATTDAEKIRRWWHESPDANVAIPTGEASGLLVLDVDPEKGGREALAALEAAHGQISTMTTTAKTGGGGLHLYLRYPNDTLREGQIRNSAGELGPGLDVRGEGGYIVAPGSATKSPYEWLDRRPLADAPQWLLEALRRRDPLDGGPEKTDGARRRTRASRAKTLNAVPDGGPIPDGRRNTTLTSIAGRLHDGRGLEELAQALLETNAARCLPPLPEAAVKGIARSVYRYPACRGSASGVPRPDAETLAELDRISRARIDGQLWPGVGGKSERSLFCAFIQIGREKSTLIPSGVRIPVSVREAALKAGMSKMSVMRTIKRLRAKGVARRDDGDRSGVQAGAIVLLSGGAQGVTTSQQLEDMASGNTLRASREKRDFQTARVQGVPLTAPRLRWSAPGVLRLGKSCEAAIDALEDHGEVSTVAQLAEAVGARRPRDFRRRVLARLEDRGIITVAGSQAVSFVDDWRDALNLEREVSGEIAALRRDMAHYDRERVAYAKRFENRPDISPSEAQMERLAKLREHREAEQGAEVSGTIDELEHPLYAFEEDLG